MDQLQRVRRLTENLRMQGHPGHELGVFLLEHTNSIEYLAPLLEKFLVVAKMDLEAHDVAEGLIARVIAQSPLELGRSGD